MPVIYLSPSTQDWNQYVTGSGSEEYHMNLLADALEPYLLSNGIQFKRNRPDMTAASSIQEANRGYYDLYLALHSNAAPEGRYGEERGIIAFYYPGSTQGQRAAQLLAEELRNIYPIPELVREFKRQGFGAIISSDCHDGRQLAHGYEEARELLASCGFTERYILTETGFKAVEL